MTIQFIMSVCVCVVVLHTNTHRMWYNRSLHINSIVTKHYSFDTCSVCACTCAATVAYHLFVQMSKDQIYIQCANRIQCSPSSGHFSCIPFPVPKSLIRFSNTEPYELNIYLMMVCASPPTPQQSQFGNVILDASMPGEWPIIFFFISFHFISFHFIHTTHYILSYAINLGSVELPTILKRRTTKFYIRI